MLKALFRQAQTSAITPQQARSRLSSGDPVILLDVRTPEEYEENHIPNSISLPLNLIKQNIAALAPDKDTEIIIYCQSGARSSAACSQLMSMGYTNVCNMGGIQSWRYETVRGRR